MKTKMAGFLGAFVGSKAASRIGAASIALPAQTATSFRELLQKGLDPAQRLVVDAIQDESLFREVFLSPLKKTAGLPELSKQAGRRLNAWLATLQEENNREEEK